MGIKRVLIIDDEMYPQGSRETKYGRLSEADIGVMIKSLLESQGFIIEFQKRGEDGLERIKNDFKKEIKLVLLDIRFIRVDTKMQGPEIFRKIKEIRSNLPIVIITVEPTRKIAQRKDIFKELAELGASLWVEKKYLARRGKEQISFINALVNQQDIKYILKYREGRDYNQIEILDIDIVRKDRDAEFSILKNPHRISYPLCFYITELIGKFPKAVHWKEIDVLKKEMTDIEFHKAVHKLNDAILRSSGGRIPNLLERLGRTGCRFNVNRVMQL